MRLIQEFVENQQDWKNVRIRRESAPAKYYPASDILTGKIRIYTDSRPREIPESEPEIRCTVVDENNGICIESYSTHHGLFWQHGSADCEIKICGLARQLREQGRILVLDYFIDRPLHIYYEIIYNPTDAYFDLDSKKTMHSGPSGYGLYPENSRRTALMGNGYYGNSYYGTGYEMYSDFTPVRGCGIENICKYFGTTACNGNCRYYGRHNNFPS